ncbi:flagella basal body P-ring formation protein FlgA [Citromicrobium bathyomarinum]|uniref:flagella basal body P-ring formation protein FlgA n=1 Tax=Citromicrobium bathyomarinum TaxID=72174 RepID=UPI00315A1475
MHKISALLATGLLTFTGLAASSAAANAPMDPAEIDRAVAQFTGAGIGQPGGARLPVDRRMRLNPCGSPLLLEWYGKARESVQVQCPDAGWRIYVAVAQAQGPSGAATQPGQADAGGEIVISRGETVSIIVAGGGFSLSRQAVAMEEGAVGSWIKVRPTQDKKADPVRAQVVRPGQVAVRLR